MRLLRTGSRVYTLLGQNGKLLSSGGWADVGVGPRKPLQLRLPGHLSMAVASYRTTPWVEPTINELPIPEGSWDVAYKKKQQKYGRHLFLGSGFFIFTIFVMFTSGLVQFNATIPELDAEYMAQGNTKCPPTPPPTC